MKSDDPKQAAELCNALRQTIQMARIGGVSERAAAMAIVLLSVDVFAGHRDSFVKMFDDCRKAKAQ